MHWQKQACADSVGNAMTVNFHRCCVYYLKNNNNHLLTEYTLTVDERVLQFKKKKSGLK